jgi:hypothetical protein
VAAGAGIAATVDACVKGGFEPVGSDPVDRWLEDRPAVERDREVTVPTRFERREQSWECPIEVEQIEEGPPDEQIPLVPSDDREGVRAEDFDVDRPAVRLDP